MSYARRFGHILQSGNLGEIEKAPATQKSDIIKALIILSKYGGFYEQLKAGLNSRGIKLSRPNALSAFTRIYNNTNSDLSEWLEKVHPALRPQENLLIKFARVSGLREGEAFMAFNLIIELSKQGRLSEYVNTENGIVEHFRFKRFLRQTKNAFISIVPERLIEEITESEPTTYPALIKRLQRRKLHCRINELRDQFGTFLIKHGLVKAEIDLLQGRVSADIFTRHYFSPAILELRDRTLNALREMERGD